MVLKLNLPLQKKIALSCLFGLGVFDILCAILSKYYSFVTPFDTIWEEWYTRESSTAIIICNMPHCWALWRHVFHLRSFIGTKGNSTPGLSGSQNLQLALHSTAGTKSDSSAVRQNSGASVWGRHKQWFKSEDTEAMVGNTNNTVRPSESKPNDSRPSIEREMGEDDKLFKVLNFRVDATPITSSTMTASPIEPAYKP